MIYDNIIKTIDSDLDLVNKTNIIFLLIILILFYFLKRDNYFILTIISIIKKIKNKSDKPLITKKEDNDTEIIQISNKRNRTYILKKNVYSLLQYFKLCILNLDKKPIDMTNIFIRTLSYENTYSVIRYSKKIKNIPDKFVLLLNHTHLIHDDYTHIYLNLMLFPEHTYCIITNNNICNKYKILEKLKNVFYYQYSIKNKETIYQDITDIINKHKKIIIIIYPEGYSFRKCSLDYYDINKPNIQNFEIIEEKCFNYKKGAFEISISNNIPILQTIFYSPMPNYKYKYFGKEYEIKHINHIGINIYNFQKFKKRITVENYRKTMENLFKKRYIDTLINAHRFNPMFNKKVN